MIAKGLACLCIMAGGVLSAGGATMTTVSAQPAEDRAANHTEEYVAFLRSQIEQYRARQDAVQFNMFLQMTGSALAGFGGGYLTAQRRGVSARHGGGV